MKTDSFVNCKCLDYQLLDSIALALVNSEQFIREHLIPASKEELADAEKYPDAKYGGGRNPIQEEKMELLHLKNQLNDISTIFEAIKVIPICEDNRPFYTVYRERHPELPPEGAPIIRIEGYNQLLRKEDDISRFLKE